MLNELIIISQHDSGPDQVVIDTEYSEHGVIISPPTFEMQVGSGFFGTTTRSFMASSPSSDWAFGTDAFTWEWWQYQTSSSLSGRWQFPRIFQTHVYPNAGMGVTIEGSPNSMYVWCGSSFVMSRALSGHINKWTHFAVARTGSSLRLFQDGIQLGSTVTNSTNIFEDSRPLFIGLESGSTNTAFPGYITNLHLVKGMCKYTSDFTPSNEPFQIIPGHTVFLLRMGSAETLNVDSSQYDKIVTASFVPWSSNSPF